MIYSWEISMRTSRLHFFLLDGYQDLIAGLLSCLMHSGWMMIIAYFMAVCAGNRSSCANSCYDNWIGLQFPSASVGWHGTAAWGTALLLNIHGGFVFWGKKFPPWLIPGSIVSTLSSPHSSVDLYCKKLWNWSHSSK